MIGGKTGTTGKAGSCLVTLTQDGDGTQYISLVYHAQTKAILYGTMTDLLEKTQK
jgi:D-alanyl-D-alanine carboxypeptidase